MKLTGRSWSSTGARSKREMWSREPPCSMASILNDSRQITLCSTISLSLLLDESDQDISNIRFRLKSLDLELVFVSLVHPLYNPPDTNRYHTLEGESNIAPSLKSDLPNDPQMDKVGVPCIPHAIQHAYDHRRVSIQPDRVNGCNLTQERGIGDQILDEYIDEYRVVGLRVENEPKQQNSAPHPHHDLQQGE